ncbi:hypothetical protein AUC45_11595 [Erythrobacter sp. YT30]|nr:hypothetical protein AUC45_11595 [Erythrobacter sp. YT30]
MLPEFTTALRQCRGKPLRVVKRGEESHSMGTDEDAPAQKNSLWAGLMAAVMLVGFCFTIALVTSGNASIAATSEPQSAD